MSRLMITAVGQDIFKIVTEKFEMAELPAIPEINTGMLGNLKTRTWQIVIEDEEVINMRNRLMRVISEDSMRLMPMFVNGDWMRIFIFRPIKS